MERFSESLVISNVEIQTTVRSHYTPTRTAKNKTKQTLTINSTWRRRRLCGARGALRALGPAWWAHGAVRALRGNVWRFPTRVRLSYGPEISPRQKRTYVFTQSLDTDVWDGFIQNPPSVGTTPKHSNWCTAKQVVEYPRKGMPPCNKTKKRPTTERDRLSESLCGDNESKKPGSDTRALVSSI